jgi:hypothetical protein
LICGSALLAEGSARRTSAPNRAPAAIDRASRSLISFFPGAQHAGNLHRQTKRRAASLAKLRELRSQARAEIDRLIAFLDASDLDPDLEPALGFPEANISVGGGGYYGPSYTSQGDQTRSAGSADDRETDDSDLEQSLCGVTADGLRLNAHCRLTGAMAVDDGEQEADDEPSLGFLELHPSHYGGDQDGRNRSGNQDGICAGSSRDMEDEHDGAEDMREDFEPSLGATEQFNQSLWADSDRGDREGDGPATLELFT